MTNLLTRTAALIGLSVALTAPAYAGHCSSRGPVAQVSFVAPRPPLPPVYAQPIPPAPHAVWIAGDWQWTGRQWTWQAGYWQVPQPTVRITTGHGYRPAPPVVMYSRTSRGHVSRPIAPQRPTRPPTRTVVYR